MTKRSLKYESEKSCTVPDSLVTIEPAGSLCNLITRFASVKPSTASSKESQEGAYIATGTPLASTRETALDDFPD